VAVGDRLARRDALRATVVLVLAAAVVQTLRKGSARVRHGVLVLAAGALVALPVASALLPAWRVSILASAEPAVSVVPRLAVSTTAKPGPPRPRARPSSTRTTANRGRAGRTTVPAVATAPRLGRACRAAALLVWLAGVALALARLAYGAVVIRRVGRRATLVTDDAWHTLLERCTRELALSRPPLLLQSPAVTAAVVYGHRRPVVVLSAGADAWPYEQRRAFLLHELAHASRRDVATRTLAEIARAVYWPHRSPGGWCGPSRRRRSAPATIACWSPGSAPTTTPATCSTRPATWPRCRSRSPSCR
jgi:beta-lactamase regulating signal transducer with metallopeptidase domain